MKSLQVRNQKLQQQVLNSLSQKDKMLVINHYDNMTFGAFDNEQKKELAKQLVKLSYFVGIKEPLSIDNLKLLVMFLCTQFSSCTMNQLEQAFMMACSGELDMDFEHYQNFSPIYVSKIIRGYEQEKSKALTNYMRLEQKKKQEEEEEEKRKNFNPIESTIKILHDDFQLYLNDKFIENKSNDIQVVVKRMILNSFQKNGLFKGYNDKMNPIEYLERYFKTLPKDSNLAKEKIEKYVSTNWNNQKN
jgi:hypothetical protein